MVFLSLSVSRTLPLSLRGASGGTVLLWIQNPLIQIKANVSASPD